MVQFKRIFQGLQTPPYPTATTVQKCVRAGGKHNDLENVGRTARHHTFFEMLGNFSFGAYFKEDAIRYAWEFITQELKLSKEKIYVTVFHDDDEAYTHWKNCGIHDTHIFRLGEKDNFWSMADTGPCGPCSEIFYDQGAHLACGDSCGIGSCDCDRFLEIWNLVFMQYDQHADGTRTALPKPSIDTGIGLERLAAVCQGVYSNYDIDLFQDIIAYISTLTNNVYTYKKHGESVDTAFRVIADHARAIAFLISDGVMPSNEGRGYVLRRIIRRAYRFGRELELTEPFLYKVAHHVVMLMCSEYKELNERDTFMQGVVKNEEESFHKTLDNGLTLLQGYIEKYKKQGIHTLSGEDAFLLYDTYGFPIDILYDIAQQHSMDIDTDVLNTCIEKQRQLARSSWKGANTTLHTVFSQVVDLPETVFTGYTDVTATTPILRMFAEDGTPVTMLREGEYGYIVTETTTLYPTAGGQSNDIGTLVTQDTTADIIDVLKSPNNVIIHAVYITNGILHDTTTVAIAYNTVAREATAKNHTATHLIFAALRKLLGQHVRQAGSSVTAEKLRLDFTHTTALSSAELLAVETEVNTIIQKAIPAVVQEMPKEKALEKGAIALANEEYDPVVRVVSYGTYSMELCCGTHTENTGNLGACFILSETGVATGIRRIEALTGTAAINYTQRLRTIVHTLTTDIQCTQEDVLTRYKQQQEEKKALQTRLQTMTQKYAHALAKISLNAITDAVLAQQIPLDSTQDLKYALDYIKQSHPSCIVCFIGATQEKTPLLLHVPQQYHAVLTTQDIFNFMKEKLTVKGGGKKDMLQAVIENATNTTITSALQALIAFVQTKVQS